jgi:hypothetical protein
LYLGETAISRQGNVFLHRFGQPSQDSRLAKIPGGNPIKNERATACKRAGVSLTDWPAMAV